MDTDNPTATSSPRHRSTGWRWRFAKWAALVGSVFLVVAGVMDYRATEQFKADGETVKALFVDSKVLKGGRGSRTYKITLDYTPLDYEPKNEPRGYRKAFSVPKSLAEQAAADGYAMVTYLRSDPTKSTAGEVRTNYESFAMAGGLFLVGIVLWLVQRKRG